MDSRMNLLAIFQPRDLHFERQIPFLSALFLAHGDLKTLKYVLNADAIYRVVYHDLMATV